MICKPLNIYKYYTTAIIIVLSLLFKTVQSQTDSIVYNKIQSVETTIFSNPDKALENALTILKSAFKNNSDTIIAEAHSLIAKIMNIQGMDAQAIEHYSDAIDIYLDVNDTLNTAWFLHEIGNIYFRNKMFNNAEKNYKTAIAIFKAAGMKTAEATALNNIGLIAIEKNNYKAALQYFLQARKLRKSSKKYKVFNLLHSDKYIGDLYLKMGDSITAMKYYNEILKSNEVGDKLNLKGETYQMIGEISMINNEIDKANNNFELARQNYLENYNPILLCELYLLQADIATKNTNYQKAINFLNKADILCIESGLYVLEIDVIDQLLTNYKQLGDFQKLVHYYHIKDTLFTKYHSEQMQKSLSGVELKIELTKLQKHLDDKKYQNAKNFKEIAILKKDKYRMKLVQQSYIFVFVVIVFIALLYLLNKRNREQKRRLENELIKQEKKKIETNLRTSEKELALNAMHLVQINELIHGVNKKLTQLQGDINPNNKPQISKIISEIKMAHMDDAWSEFETRFLNVHKGFFDKLLTISPELTPSELKTCSFIKLNMTSKEIALITNRSIRTIESNRSSIRKKLKLHSNDSLTKFMLSLVIN